MLCCTLLYVLSSFETILMGKRVLVVLLSLCSWCLVHDCCVALPCGARGLSAVCDGSFYLIILTIFDKMLGLVWILTVQ